jgi:cell division protein FtsI (penicillin-binding protein 3)
MRRTRVLNVSLFIISIGFFGYLFYIQCLQHQHYENRAKNQHERKFVLIGARGHVYDRNGLPIATSQQCFSIFCTPRYVCDKKRVTRDIALISGRPESVIRRSMQKGTFFWIERRVNLEQRDKYLAIDDPGIGFTHDLHRQYNMSEIFRSLIGVCGSDNCGISGLELQFDDILSGKSGFAIYQKDPTGETFPYHNYPEKDPIPGQNVYLTIDLQMQSILYANLKEAMQKEDARYAAGLIIDPHTGEIIALVNVGRDDDYRNHAVCDEFEPGSTFKIVTLTHALLQGIQENDVIDTEGGTYRLRGHTIHDYKNYGRVTFSQAIAHSSNVAMVKLSLNFDRQKYFLLMRDLGFGQLTGVEFPGEVEGRIPDIEKINDIEFATLTFGQGLTVNLLQLAYAYQAIANGGVLSKPIIVSEIRDNGKVAYRSRPLRIRRVTDTETAERVTDMLCAVVEGGSGTEAAIQSVKVAGKTGTAQKVVDGRYSNSSIITTFIGYFPAHDPDYLIAVLLDEPKRGLWASAIAAPVFRNIAQSIYQMNSHQYAAQ